VGGFEGGAEYGCGVGGVDGAVDGGFVVVVVVFDVAEGYDGTDGG